MPKLEIAQKDLAEMRDLLNCVDPRHTKLANKLLKKVQTELDSYNKYRREQQLHNQLMKDAGLTEYLQPIAGEKNGS